MAVNVGDLAAAVLDELQAYSEEVMTGLKKEVKAVAKECRAEIQAKSPMDTGDYRDGWKVKKAYDSADDIRLVVHNDAHFQRTHLLEDGHANVDGGRTSGTPHIRPAAERAAASLEERAKVICHESG